MVYVFNFFPSENVTREFNSTDLKEVDLAMTYYDFSVGNDDFGPSGRLLSTRPYHLVSPHGSWLAISDNPLVDSFSEWFRSTSSNVEIKGEITLSNKDNMTNSDVKR